MPKLLCANPLCGDEVIPSFPFKHDCIFDGKKWWHLDCFKKTFPNKRIDRWLEKTETYISDNIEKESLYSYLKSEYDLSGLSISLKNKIDAIVHGSVSDQKISYTKLLDMFKYFHNQLADSRDYRRRSNIEGMVVTSYGEPCIRYDLNTLSSKINEYDMKMAFNKSQADQNSRTLSLTSPDMIPFYKEQQYKDMSSGKTIVQNMMDSMWDEIDCSE